MNHHNLFAGPAMRRLRRREGMTQIVMAGRLGISPSYLNLIERNQRPLSARVLMQLVAEFHVDPLSLQADSALGGVDGLARRMSDPRFADLEIERGEINDLLATTPHIAIAFARLYDNATPGSVAPNDPVSDSRRVVEQWRNHFADLDHAAEQLSDELRLSRGDTGTALVEHLRNRHRLSVRVLPQEVMPDLTRRLDLHARQVQLSEMLSPSSRNFHLAVQLARLEQQGAVASLAAGSGLAKDNAARALLERHLYAYFAAAVIMPYRRFLRAAIATGYDLPVLQNRFGVSFEQLAHRLTTLQRVGERGLPFFMARVDPAGQFSKRLSGASGATFLDDEHSCPLWHVHRAFSRAGEWQVQRIDVDAAMPNDWVTISRTVGRAENNNARFAVTLGLETHFADELTQLRRGEASPLPATPTGRGCTRCYRLNCRQRSRLPEGAALRPDRMSEGAMPFNFAPADLGLN